MDVRGFSLQKISDDLKNRGIDVGKSGIHKFLTGESTRPIVSKLRQRFLSDPFAVKISHKRIRLEDLNRERERIIRTIDSLTDKEGKILDKKISKYLGLTKRLVEIEIAGREEVERKPDMLAYFSRKGPFAEVDDADLRRKLGEIEEKLLIIRGGAPLSTGVLCDQPRVGESGKGQST